MIKIYPEIFPKLKSWIESRGGIAVWKSINLSNPGKEIFTPALTEDNKPYPKPSWEVSNQPYEIIKSLEDIIIIIPKEIKRFKVFTRISSNGLSIRLTDSSSQKVRRYESGYENSWHEFDYENQQAVILIPDKEILAYEYLNLVHAGKI